MQSAGAQLIEGLVENWIEILSVAFAAFVLGWYSGRVGSGRVTSPRTPSPASFEIAARHPHLLGEDVSTNARVAAIKRLRVLRPDLNLKEAMDAVEAIVIRRRMRL